MIKIKSIDAQNVLEVSKLKDNPNLKNTLINAIFIAESKYDLELNPNAIYKNQICIGFFMYRRDKNRSEIATLCHFMIDYSFQNKGMDKIALEMILKGLKSQGVKKVFIKENNHDEKLQKLYFSFGFQWNKKTKQLEINMN